jgi:hypothetical protein
MLCTLGLVALEIVHGVSLTMLGGCKPSYADRCDEVNSCSELSEDSYKRCTDFAEATEAIAETAGCTDPLDRLASCEIDNLECGTEPPNCFDDLKAVNDCLRAAGKSSPECQQLNAAILGCCEGSGRPHFVLETAEADVCKASLEGFTCEGQFC